MNIIYILSDDHWYDFMVLQEKDQGCKHQVWIKISCEGSHIKNAFVTTALCSPSRVSILTGQYAHTHTVVDSYALLLRNLMIKI